MGADHGKTLGQKSALRVVPFPEMEWFFSHAPLNFSFNTASQNELPEVSNRHSESAKPPEIPETKAMYNEGSSVASNPMKQLGPILTIWCQHIPFRAC